MSAEQWSVDDFREQRLLYRSSRVGSVLLGVAYLPFTIGLVYWVACQFVKPFYNNADVFMWVSLALGALLAAAAQVVTEEWLRVDHYNRLHKDRQPLLYCSNLLGAALRDDELVEAFVLKEQGARQVVRRYLSGERNLDDGIAVSRCDDESLLKLIDAYVRKYSNLEVEGLKRSSQNV